MAKLESVEGIGNFYAGKLRTAGIGTTEALLEAGATPAGRKALAEDAGVSEKLILEWVNLSDLYRIKEPDRNIHTRERLLRRPVSQMV